MGTVLFVLIIAFAALGLVIGFVKGFTNVKSWGVEYLIAVLVTAGVGKAVANMGGDKPVMPAVLTLVTAVASLLIMMLLTAGLRGLLKKRRKKRYERALADYDDDDGMGELDDEYDYDDDGMDDFDEDDEPKKKKKSNNKGGKKKKPKESKGACGIVDRIIGAFALAIKGAVMAVLLISVVLVIVDLIQIEAVSNVFASAFEQQLWKSLKPNVMDMLIIFVMLLCIKNGFRAGIMSTLWGLLLFALVAGAGFASYNFAFKVEAFQPAAEGLASTLSGVEFIKQIEQFVSPLLLARIIITAGLFVLFAVLIVLFSIFVPKLINVARDGNAFYAVDGFFGALIMSAVVLGVLLFVGFLVNPLKDFEFMAKFNEYFEGNGISTYFYSDNVLTTMGVLPDVSTKIKDIFTVKS